MSRIEREARRVFAQRAEHYTDSPAHRDAETLDRLVELADPQPDDTVLDVATGTAHTALALAPHVRRVLGLDLTRAMLVEGRRLAVRSGADVALGLADAHALPAADASVDVVVCRRSCHHFSRLARALEEMHRVLAPGGRLVIDDRSVPEDPLADDVLNELDRLHDPSHVREHPPSAWRRLLADAGFVAIGVEPYERERPLTSLTGKAAPERAERIRERLAGLSEQERERVGYRPGADDEEATLVHLYLLAWADKPPA